MAVAVAVVAASALLLLLLRGASRGPSRPRTLRDPQAKYPLPLLGKEVSGGAGESELLGGPGQSPWKRSWPWGCSSRASSWLGVGKPSCSTLLPAPACRSRAPLYVRMP